ELFLAGRRRQLGDAAAPDAVEVRPRLLTGDRQRKQSADGQRQRRDAEYRNSPSHGSLPVLGARFSAKHAFTSRGQFGLAGGSPPGSSGNPTLMYFPSGKVNELTKPRLLPERSGWMSILYSSPILNSRRSLRPNRRSPFGPTVSSDQTVTVPSAFL